MTENPTKPKRKKISWACNHCHKAHITCDSGRPCKRCVVRGLQDTCQDAPRKQKKYLSDVPPGLMQPRPASAQSDSYQESYMGSPFPDKNQNQNENQNQIQNQNQNQNPTLHQNPQNQNQNQSFQNQNHVHPDLQGRLPDHLNPNLNESLLQNQNLQNHSQNSHKSQNSQNGLHHGNNQMGQNFQNQHQNQNHQIQNQLQNQNPHNQNPQNLNQQNLNQQNQNPAQNPLDYYYPGFPKRDKRTNFLSSAADMEYSTLSNILSDNFGVAPQHPSHDSTPNSGGSPGISPHYNVHKASPSLATNSYSAWGESDMRFDARINQYALGSTEENRHITFPEVSEQVEFLRRNQPDLFHARNAKSAISFTIGVLEDADPAERDDRNIDFKEPEEIYARISKPYSYTPGYHRLIAYLRGRFPKDMLVKMAKSMAVYRPSFIACTNSLREADLIFMEQCFHRTLLTYDNFIKVSGTPTIVWRRTGEIAYVGKEFSILTGWTQQQLMGSKPTFIVELLDDASVVEYFELFSKIAFGDFLGATMTQCTLLTPQKDVKIRAGCMWTLKRDVFGIPMMVIGNFLPVIQE